MSVGLIGPNDAGNFDDLAIRENRLVSADPRWWGPIDRDYADTGVIRNVNLHVDGGEMVALMGPNGAVKTTTLLSLGAVMPSISGEVEILGSPVKGSVPTGSLGAAPRQSRMTARSSSGSPPAKSLRLANHGCAKRERINRLVAIDELSLGPAPPTIERPLPMVCQIADDCGAAVRPRVCSKATNCSRPDYMSEDLRRAHRSKLATANRSGLPAASASRFQ